MKELNTMPDTIAELRGVVTKNIQKREISLSQCAYEIGISPHTFMRFMNGTSNPQYLQLVKIHKWVQGNRE